MNEKVIIKNRKSQKLVLIINIVKTQKGLAFIMHGLGGFKEQPHIQTIAKAFKEEGHSTILFDTAHTIGESEGNYEDATITNYYGDLEDVIQWAKEQKWYEEPFYLSGHSLGGICIGLYAENNPDKVKAIAPISTVVSGKLSFEAHKPEELGEWQKTGWQVRESMSKPGLIKRLKWSHMEDRLKYDLLKEVDKLTMPVLLIVGENDESTPVKHQQMLFDKLPRKKEMHIIKNAPHTFRENVHLNEIKSIFREWLKNTK